ncbi:MAG: hypothetical protein EG828_13280 [Deltaproteobacteria bacterium]|nr:hypothetical protein [Deltaproteobacteria bacterium]
MVEEIDDMVEEIDDNWEKSVIMVEEIDDDWEKSMQGSANYLKNRRYFLQTKPGGIHAGAP